MKNLSLIALLFFATPTLAALSPAEVNDRDTRLELAEMNNTLKEIAALMKEQASLQRSDLLMRRVTLASTELAAAQERLKRLDQELTAIKSEQAEFEGMLSRVQAENTTSEESRATRQVRINGIKNRLAAIQERNGVVNRETISAQNEIEPLRRDLQDWRNLLDRALAKP
jgi:chromosome segregation ATPase